MPVTSGTSVGSSRHGRVLEQPHTELFFGLVGAIGTDLSLVADELARQLARYSYMPRRIGMSNFLAQFDWRQVADAPAEVADGLADKPYDERVWARMTAGDLLRAKWDYPGALALMAISEVEAVRKASAGQPVEQSVFGGWPTLDRHAFIFRSLKTAGEVATFREVYGPRFFLIAAHCSEQARGTNLRRLIAKDRRHQPEADWAHAPSQLISRDWNEELESGQDVSGTFHQADFFIDAESNATTKADLDRVLNLIFANPHMTPSRDEYGMFLAAGSARRSAEMGRQVGAAIATPGGSVIALGVNEVPAFGGGPYWPDHPHDAREFQQEREANTAAIEDIADDVTAAATRLLQRFIDGGGTNSDGISADAGAALIAELPRQMSDVVLRETSVRQLTEYMRATHAEMSAMLDAARRGIAIQDATLFVTTFPCHGCAKSIVESGIRRLLFIEPYAKSQALHLHADSIELVSGVVPAKDQTKVQFQPFVGVAPRQYLTVFDAWLRQTLGYPGRKSNSGAPVDFEPLRASAWPLFIDRESEELRPAIPVYRYREARVLDFLNKLFERSDPPLAAPDAHVTTGT